MKENIIEILKFLLLILVTIVPFRILVAEPYIVSGISMSNTLETGHYLIINKFKHKITGLERGDLVVFNPPHDKDKTYIKRVVGLPGETLKIENQEVFIKNETIGEFSKINEPYIKNPPRIDNETTIGEKEYFVMGDNRDNSSDSRSWGVVKHSSIKGEPVIRLFPLKSISYMPGHYDGYKIDKNTN